MSFVGSMTALVTPLQGGTVDEKALRAHVERQIAGGIDALVPCGTTGESATLDAAEQARVIKIVVETAAGRVPIIAGAGSSSTKHAIALAKAAREAGASGILAVTPYYNRPSQEGLYQHFKTLVEEAGLPTVLYNVPARTGVDLLPETVLRLAELPLVVGLKEATGSIPRAQQLVARLPQRVVLLSGDDAINYPLYAVGARGCISVVSNLAPKIVADGWRAARDGKHDEARRLHMATVELAEALFAEPSPGPTKSALALLRHMSEETRLPMLPATAQLTERLRLLVGKHQLA